VADGLGKQAEQLVREMATEAAQQAVAETQDPNVVREPDTGQPNPYATRLRSRLTADQDYFVLQSYFGHEQACTLVCNRHGHEARAGRCMRCGTGVSGAEVRERRKRS
jgi:cation diffusion facilitator CzcD-associated flavoprotein CzcO